MNTYIKWALQSLQASIAIGLIIASVIISFLVVIPRLREAISFQSQIQASKQTANRLASKVNQLEELNKSDLQSRLLVVLQTLPSEFDVPYIISTIKQLARESNIEVIDMSANVRESNQTSASDKNKSNEIQIQQISLTVKANPQSVLQFFQGLEQIVPLFKVTKFSVQTGQTEDENLTKIEIESYALPLPEIDPTKPVSDISEFTATDEQLYQSLTTRKYYEFNPSIVNQNEIRVDPFKVPQ